MNKVSAINSSASAVMMTICWLCLFLATVRPSACAFENYPGVHFNTNQPDFGAPPRSLNIYTWEEPNDRAIGCASRTSRNVEDDYDLRSHWQALSAAALRHARRLEDAGHFAESIPLYRFALRHGAGDSAAVMDRKELLAELTPATDRQLLTRYLAARRDYESSHPGRGAQQMKALAYNPHAGIFRPHALYVLAAMQYDDNYPDQAAAMFEYLARSYPRSRLREAAFIMIPRSLLHVPDPEQGGYKEWVGKAIPGGNAIKRSRRALQTLLREYPHTRFRQSAVAWLARCDYLQGRRVAALESYLHQYATFTGDEDRERAATSVRFVSRELTPTEAKQLRGDLRWNLQVLGDYLEYRLEHGGGSHQDLARLVDQAVGVAGTHRLHLQPRTAAYLAEAQYLRKRYRDAIVWSDTALSAPSGPGKDLALYVRGASYGKSGQSAAAASSFHQLLRRYPASYLCGAARENLALLDEHRGRLDLALDEYFQLGYQEDIAYLLDARMSTSQVAAYLAAHPRHPRRNLLIYTLGIRYLRDNQYAQALTALSCLSTKTIHTLMMPENKEYWWWDDKHNRIRDLFDPRKTARDLASLDRAISLAHGANAKARARYARASYLYNNRNLLFYNTALWQGQRSVDFSFYWNIDIATRSDRNAVREYHYAHECLYRARVQYLEIARQYQHSPFAPKALYRAACASDRLANFDYWWRSEDDRLHLSDDAIQLMKRVYRRYPQDPLAKSARKFAKVYTEARAQAIRDRMFAGARYRIPDRRGE